MLDLLCVAGTEIIDTEDIVDIYEHRNYLNDVVTTIIKNRLCVGRNIFGQILLRWCSF